jgi:hypothetical protein
MTSTRSDARPSGLVTGCLIAISFGTVFIMVNSAGLAAPWPLILRVAAAVTAVALVVAVFRIAPKARPGQPTGGPGFADKRYWIIVGIEVAALFGGLYLINGVWSRPDVGVAWVATVVGLHFFGLAWAWRMPIYHGLGAAMTVLGLAGFLVYGLGGSGATVGLIAGVGSGVALYATVVAALRQSMVF